MVYMNVYWCEWQMQVYDCFIDVNYWWCIWMFYCCEWLTVYKLCIVTHLDNKVYSPLCCGRFPIKLTFHKCLHRGSNGCHSRIIIMLGQSTTLTPYMYLHKGSTTSPNHKLQNNLHNIQRKVTLIFQCTFTPSCITTFWIIPSHLINITYVKTFHEMIIFLKKNNQKTFYTLPVQGEGGSEWVIKFNGLSGDSGQWGPYSPYKPCNHSLYIGIIIFPHIDYTQSIGHN